MNNLKISTRLLVLMSVFSVLLVTIGAMGLTGLVRSNEALHRVYVDRTLPMETLSNLLVMQLRNRQLIADSLLDPTEETYAKNSAAIEANIAEIGRLWDRYMAAQLTPEEKTLAQNVAEARNAAHAAHELQMVSETLRQSIARFKV